MLHDVCTIGDCLAAVEREFGGLWESRVRLGAIDAPIARVLLAAQPAPDAVAERDLQLTIADLPAALSADPRSLAARMTAACVERTGAWGVLGALGFDPPGAALDRWIARHAPAGCGASPLLAPPPRATVAVYVPAEGLDRVRAAVWGAGAGVIGAYDRCSYAAAGRGTYRPLAQAQPYRGSVGSEEHADEWRLEFQCMPERLEAVLGVMLAAHPYEEVAYAVVPPSATPAKGRGYGRLCGQTALVAGDADPRIVEVASARGARRLLAFSAPAAARAAALDAGVALEALSRAEMEAEALAFLAQRLGSLFSGEIAVATAPPGPTAPDVQRTRLP